MSAPSQGHQVSPGAACHADTQLQTAVPLSYASLSRLPSLSPLFGKELVKRKHFTILLLFCPSFIPLLLYNESYSQVMGEICC